MVQVYPSEVPPVKRKNTWIPWPNKYKQAWDNGWTQDPVPEREGEPTKHPQPKAPGAFTLYRVKQVDAVPRGGG